VSHQHSWRRVRHLDGCHYYTSHYLCDCGAVRVTRDERDTREDEYSSLWFLAECERCMELADGAEPLHSDEVEVPA